MSNTYKFIFVFSIAFIVLTTCMVIYSMYLDQELWMYDFCNNVSQYPHDDCAPYIINDLKVK